CGRRWVVFFFQAEDGIRDFHVTGVQTCALPIYAWDSRVVLGLGAGALAATVLFLVAERFAAEPLIPLRLFRDSVFNVTGLVGLVTGVALFGAASYLPTYLQMVDGATATESGLLMLPMMAGIVCASVISGQLISRTGRYRSHP